MHPFVVVDTNEDTEKEANDEDDANLERTCCSPRRVFRRWTKEANEDAHKKKGRKSHNERCRTQESSDETRTVFTFVETM